MKTLQSSILKVENNSKKVIFSRQENKIIQSYLSDFEYSFQKPTLSIKYVINGAENYRIHQRTHCLQSQEFLVVNGQQDYQAYSPNSRRNAEGFCIYLSQDLLASVQHYQESSPEALLDSVPEQACDFHFLEQKQSCQQSSFGQFIRNLSQNIVPEDITSSPLASDDLFIRIAEELMAWQKTLNQNLKRLSSSKASTRQELYRRLEIARDYLESNYAEKVDIKNVAKIASISEYHFYRCFKELYGQSPYQYILNKRLLKAESLLRSSELRITEIAYQTGFADIHTFGKAFRKKFQISPRKARKML